jgi:hypothetical protein
MQEIRIMKHEEILHGKFVVIFSKKKVSGLSPKAKYTDRATAACRGS